MPRTFFSQRFYAFILVLVAAVTVQGQDELVSYKLNLVRDPLTKRYGYAFKKQNINSPIRGMTSTAVNVFGKSGSILIGKDEAENIDWAVPPQYEEAASEFKENLAMVRVGDKVGFIDMYNCFVIAPAYDCDTDIDGFHEGLAAVKWDGKWGYINKLGDEVIPFIYDDADNFDEDMLAAVKVGGVWGAIDITGAQVVEPEKKTKLAMKTNPATNKEWREASKAAKEKKANGAFDARIAELHAASSTCNELISANLRQNLIYTYVDVGDSIGVVDQYGRTIVPPVFSSVELSDDAGVFVVKRDGLYGAYLYNGSRLIRPCFDTMSPFVDGRSQVSAVGVTGWIDTDGCLDPDFLYTIANNGMEAEKTDAYEARRMYNRILDINPEYAPAYNNLALLDIDAHDFNKGMRKLKLAHELAPEDTVIAKNLKWAKESRKERRNERWRAGLEIVTAVLGIAVTTYSAYSAIKGESTSGSADTYSYSDVGQTGTSSGGKAKASGSVAVCSQCAGSGTCTSPQLSANKIRCHGSGKCVFCTNGVKYVNGHPTDCPTCDHGECKFCKGTGKCSKCHGTGKP